MALQTRIVDPCIASTGRFLEHDSRAAQQADRLGTVLSLMDRLGADVLEFDKWRNSDDRARMNDFKPSQVRRSLELLNVPTPVGKDIYKALPERATHVTPSTRPELHSNVDHPLAGGYFQEDGVRTCIAHIGFAFGMTALAATRLLQPEEFRAATIVAAASALIDSVGSQESAGAAQPGDATDRASRCS